MNNAQQQFSQWYEQYIDEIYRYVFFAVHQHKEQAEDITATVFMKAWKAIDRFDSEKASFRTYIYRIARNTVVDHYRTSKQVDDITDKQIAAKDKTTSDVDTALFWKQAQNALEPHAFEMLVLKYRNELTYEEIADITGATVNSVKSLLKRTRSHLSSIV